MSTKKVFQCTGKIQIKYIRTANKFFFDIVFL